MNNTLYQAFLETAREHDKPYVQGIHDYLIQQGCACDIKASKSGFIVSYKNPAGATLATFVNRKTGIRIRIYPQHLQQYENFLDTLPEGMKKVIKKASVCKRLLDPDDCNPRCVTGYDFMLDGEHYQKCRYMAFMPVLNEQSYSYIQAFLEKELAFC